MTIGQDGDQQTFDQPLLTDNLGANRLF